MVSKQMLPVFWIPWIQSLKEFRPCENGSIHFQRGKTEVAYQSHYRKYMCAICFSQITFDLSLKNRSMKPLAKL